MATSEMYHQAARDEYLELLREATKKDCNHQDEDGMTPTHWAAYSGHLDALRVVISRGGNPDKCDHLGSTALHHAALNGHLSCVTFLVNFGVNLWTLDNDMRTALELAGLRDHEDVVRYLDGMAAQQAALSAKLVRRMKSKALTEAQQRLQKYRKMQAKAQKKAEREDKQLAAGWQQANGSTSNVNTTKSSVTSRSQHTNTKVRPRVENLFGTLTSRKSASSPIEPKPFSAHYNTLGATTNSRKLGLGVYKKTRQQQQHKKSQQDVGDDFKVGQIEMNGQRTIRSLSGLKRDYHILYRRGDSIADDQKSRAGTRDETLSRAISEPDFAYNADSGVGSDDSTPPEAISIFERPGFGSVAFLRNRQTSGALMALPTDPGEEDGTGSMERTVMQKDVGPASTFDSKTDGGTVRQSRGVAGKIARKNSLTDSIGTVGSLAVRMKNMPWDDDDINTLDDDDAEESSPLEMFLVGNGLAGYIPFFTSESVDLKTLMLLSNDDMKELGLPLGPRKKLMMAIDRRKEILAKPGTITDTPL